MEYSGILILMLVTLSGVYVFLKNDSRSAKDVLNDLSEENEIKESPKLKKFELKMKLVPFAAVVTGILLRLFFGFTSLGSLVVVLLFSFAAGVFLTSHLKKKNKEEHQYKINFFLPLIMERLVMAVQAGQDVLPAIGSILEIEKKEKELDPVCELLQKVKKLCDSGLSFEKSLNLVADSVDNGALRHAFIHLSLAYKEGGELVSPLRELSDSTQLFYQETVEEEIAKMPIKATMPLLLTFAGLIICFITSPIIQILDVMRKAMP